MWKACWWTLSGYSNMLEAPWKTKSIFRVYCWVCSYFPGTTKNTCNAQLSTCLEYVQLQHGPDPHSWWLKRHAHPHTYMQNHASTFVLRNCLIGTRFIQLCGDPSTHLIALASMHAACVWRKRSDEHDITQKYSNQEAYWPINDHRRLGTSNLVGFPAHHGRPWSIHSNIKSPFILIIGAYCDVSTPSIHHQPWMVY